MAGTRLFRRLRFTGALASPNYLKFTGANVTSLIGSWTQRVAAAWLAWELTHSATWLGLMAFADLCPTFFISPLAGAVADRFDKLRVFRICQALAIAPPVLLLGLSAAGMLDIWLLFTLTLTLGTFQAFEQPARLALVPSLVPRGHLSSAIAINSISFNLARFLGPALAGLIIATSGVATAFAVNALSFAVCLLILGRVHLLDDDRGERKPASILSELGAGFRYTLGHPGLVVILTLLIVLNVGARPVLELLPAFSAQLLGSDATGFAILSAAVGIGATVGGLWFATSGARLSLTLVAIVSAVGTAVTAALFCLCTRLVFGTIAIAALGASLGIAGIALQSLVQLSADPVMRGRVLSIYGLLFRGGPAIGGLVMGALSETYGLRAPTLIAALVIALAAFWTFTRRQRLAAALVDPSTSP